MRKPTVNERRLIAVFGGLLFLLLNLVVIKWYSSGRQQLSAQVTALEQSVAEYRALLTERPQWEARQHWMQDHPLETHQGREADSRFAEEIQRTLTQNGLSIEAQQLKDSTEEGGLIQAQLEFRAKGRLEQVLRWLCQIQQPGKHLVVQAFTLRRMDEGDTMNAHIRIGKIFRATAGAQAP
ncbi:MAG: hypothetical protein WCQ57_02170 [Verrucomicrobiota bacterium]